MSKPRKNMLTPASVLCILFFLLPGVQYLRAQDGDTDLLRKLMQERSQEFETILSDPEGFRIQILYTQIDRDQNNDPVLSSFSYRVNSDEYFYPASSIKLFGATLTLEKFNTLGIEGLNRDARVRIDSSYSGQQRVQFDSTSTSGKPSFGHYLKKLLVLSDNDAYNRTYEFLGQEALNELLKSKGFDHVRLTHRLSVPLTPEENRHTNAMEFYTNQPNQVIYRQEAVTCSKDYSSKDAILLGRAHVAGADRVNSPMDFSAKNYCSIHELQKLMRSLIFPESLPQNERFDLTEEDYRFLRTYMSQLPRETLSPDYRSKPDNYCKFFIYGDDETKRIPESLRIFNKIGLAYGFCIDNAYIVDFENGIEFLLTAVIYVNGNQTLNDGIYEYETIAFPFMANLGRMIYDFELKREKPRKPNLEKFRLKYDLPQG